MRRLNIVLAFICFIAMVAGCSVGGAGKTLTAAQVLDAFSRSGFELSEAKELHPDSVFKKELNGVKPDTYLVGGSQLLSIYVYESGRGPAKGIKDFERQTAAADVTSYDLYFVANILLFYVTDVSDRDERVVRAVEGLRMSMEKQEEWLTKEIESITLTCLPNFGKKPCENRKFADSSAVERFRQAVHRAEKMPGMLNYVAEYLMTVTFHDLTKRDFHLSLGTDRDQSGLLVPLFDTTQGYEIPVEEANRLRELLGADGT